jgi:ABC-type iron transport system FetAB permease component
MIIKYSAVIIVALVLIAFLIPYLFNYVSAWLALGVIVVFAVATIQYIFSKIKSLKKDENK